MYLCYTFRSIHPAGFNSYVMQKAAACERVTHGDPCHASYVLSLPCHHVTPIMFDHCHVTSSRQLCFNTAMSLEVSTFESALFRILSTRRCQASALRSLAGRRVCLERTEHSRWPWDVCSLINISTRQPNSR